MVPRKGSPRGLSGGDPFHSPFSILRSPFSVLLFLLASGLSVAWSAPDPLNIGLSGMEIQERMDERYGPLQDYLQRELGRPVEIKYWPRYEDLVAAMVGRQIQMMYGFATPFVLARERGAARALVKRRWRHGTSYRGLIIARRGCGIRSLADLRGKRFAFVDPLSTGSYELPRLELARAGILHLDEFFGRVVFVHNHDAAVEAVLSGEVDAAAVASLYYERFWPQVADLDRVLVRLSESPPVELGPLSFDPRQLDPQGPLVQRLRQAFLRIRSDSPDPQLRALAAALGVEGFVPARDSDYDAVLRIQRQVARLPTALPVARSLSLALPKPLELVSESPPYVPFWGAEKRFRFWGLQGLGLLAIALALGIPARRVRRSLRARLTVCFVGLLTAVLLAVAVGAVVRQRRDIVDRTVRSRLYLAATFAQRSQMSMVRRDLTRLQQYAEEFRSGPEDHPPLAFVEGDGDLLYPPQDPFRPGEPFVAAYWVMPTAEGSGQRLAGVKIGLPWQEMEASWLNMLLLWTVLTLGALALGYGVASWLSQWLTGPIARLMEGAERIGGGQGGQLGWTIQDVRRSDEIGRLIEAFNRMSLELQRKEELQRQVAALEQSEKALEAARKREWMAFTAGLAHNFRRETSSYLRRCDDLRAYLRGEPAPDVETLQRHVAFIREIAYDRGTFFDFLHYFALRNLGQEERHTADPLELPTAGAVRDFLERLFVRGREVDIARSEGQVSKWSFPELVPCLEVAPAWPPGCLAERPVMVFIVSELLNNAVKWSSGQRPLEGYAYPRPGFVCFGLTNDLQIRRCPGSDLEPGIPLCPHPQQAEYFQWMQDLSERYLCLDCLVALVQDQLELNPDLSPGRRSQVESSGTGLGLFLTNFFITEFYRGELRLGLADEDFYYDRQEYGLFLRKPLHPWKDEPRVYCEFSVAVGKEGYALREEERPHGDVCGPVL